MIISQSITEQCVKQEVEHSVKQEAERSVKCVIYHGESQCQAHKRDGGVCTNKAYYSQYGQYLCGVHSQESVRLKLPINPHKNEIKQVQVDANMKEVDRQALDNKTHGQKGVVTCYHMRMMKPIDNKMGFLNVFPNAKHGKRTDGLGMSSLSPMKMGSIDHGQPNLPPAMNLENMHQGNKVFPSEVGDDGQPTAQFYENRLVMYRDPIPHRHKDSSGHKNIPVYSVWVTQQGQELHLSYIESRQIYCHFYEQFALKSIDFHKLRQLISNGYNLQICGYDAYVPTGDMDVHYLDSSRPFGHEMVLYTLLMLEPRQYPWRKYQTLNFLQTFFKLS